MKPVTNTERGAAKEGNADRFRFAVLADPHLRERNGVDKLTWAIEKINADPEIDFVLLLGDLLWDGPMNDLRRRMSGLTRAWHLVLGNNDHARLDEYRRTFGPLYYAFEHKDCLFIGLWNAVHDTEVPDHQGNMDAEQIAWVERKLTETEHRTRPFRHIFLFSHCPLHQNWRQGGRYWLVPPLAERWIGWCERFGVTACFFGHTHHEERFALGGTQFITTESLNWNFDTEDNSIEPFWMREWKELGGYRIVDVAEGAIGDEFIGVNWVKQSASERGR